MINSDNYIIEALIKENNNLKEEIKLLREFNHTKFEYFYNITDVYQPEIFNISAKKSETIFYKDGYIRVKSKDGFIIVHYLIEDTDLTNTVLRIQQSYLYLCETLIKYIKENNKLP